MDTKTPKTVCFVVNRQEKAVLVDTIIYAQVTDKLCTIYLTQSEPIKIFLTLSVLMNMLPSEGFIQISRNCVVSLKHIKNINDGSLLLSNTTTLPYSRRKKSAILHAFQEHLAERAMSHDSISWKLDLASEFQCFDRCPFPFLVMEIVSESARITPPSFMIRYANEALASLIRMPLHRLINFPLRPGFSEDDQYSFPRFRQVALSGGTADWYENHPYSRKKLHISCYQPHFGFCACLMVPTGQNIPLTSDLAN